MDKKEALMFGNLSEGLEVEYLMKWLWLTPDFVVNLLVAIGTLGMASVIFYLEILRKPKLSVEFKQKEPFCRFATLIENLGFIEPVEYPCYWIRVKVTNKGSRPAENCEGRLIEIKEIKEGKEKSFQPFDPVVLHWVGRSGYFPITIKEGEDAGEWLDVIYIHQNSPLANIYCDKTPRGIKTDLEVGEHLLKIAIVSGNAKPVTAKYRLIWTGKWNEVKMDKDS